MILIDTHAHIYYDDYSDRIEDVIRSAVDNGVEKIISVSAVGSMKEEYLPGHFVVPDQFVDRTNRRISTVS